MQALAIFQYYFRMQMSSYGLNLLFFLGTFLLDLLMYAVL